MSGFDFSTNANASSSSRNQAMKNLIACRVCDCVFLNDKALFDHMEVHLLLDESTTRRKLLESHLKNLQQQQQLQPLRLLSALEYRNHVSSSSSSSQPRDQTNHVLVGSNTAPILPAPVSGVSSRDNNKLVPILPKLPAFGVAPGIIFVPPTRPAPRSDCFFTRPFVNQMESNLVVEGMASYVDRVRELAAIAAHGKQPEVEVDLTLRLGRGN